MSTSPRRTAAEIRSPYDLRPAIEERHRRYKCFWDLTRMHSCALSLVVNQALFVLLACALIQAHWVLRRRRELNRSLWERAWQLLSPTLEVVAVYYRQRFCLLTLAEFARILLDIAEPARTKSRQKLSRIEKDLHSVLENARSPEPSAFPMSLPSPHFARPALPRTGALLFSQRVRPAPPDAS